MEHITETCIQLLKRAHILGMFESCASIIQSTEDLGENLCTLPESDVFSDGFSRIWWVQQNLMGRGSTRRHRDYPLPLLQHSNNWQFLSKDRLYGSDYLSICWVYRIDRKIMIPFDEHGCVTFCYNLINPNDKADIWKSILASFGFLDKFCQ